MKKIYSFQSLIGMLKTGSDHRVNWHACAFQSLIGMLKTHEKTLMRLYDAFFKKQQGKL